MSKVPFIYVRISSDPLGLRAGVRRQLDDSFATLAQRGWDHVGARDMRIAVSPRIYEDNDTSAYKGRRPQFEQMVTELDQAHCLVAYNVDRLVRQPRDLERLIDRCADVGLTRVATAQGDIDLTSHDGQLHARILGAVAKKESDDKSRRVTRALRDRSERGLWTGCRAPIGYQLSDGQLQLSDASDHVVDLVERMINGQFGITHVAEQLGVTHSTLRRTLLSPTLIGRTNTGHVGYWPAILTDLQQAELREVFEGRSRRGHTFRNHWLSGVLRCGADVVAPPGGERARVIEGSQCGHALSFMGGHNGGYYGCQHGARIANPPHSNQIHAHQTEQFVIGALLDQMTTTTRRTSPSRTTTTLSTLSTGIDAAAQDRLNELARMYVAGDLTKAELDAARAAVLPDRSPVAPVRAARREQVTAAWWGTASVAEKHRVATAWLDHVLVLPARRRSGPGQWDGEYRLHPVWRPQT